MKQATKDTLVTIADTLFVQAREMERHAVRLRSQASQLYKEARDQ